MVQDPAWQLDPLDPRAPSLEVWERLTDQEREAVCAALPSDFPCALPPEGDRHRLPKARAIEALEEFFRRIGRRVYLSSELPIYYPGERLFAPDVIAVLDVEPHERDSWVVAKEGKGLDLALEVTLHGDAKKDLNDNVDRYARLGIPEYFVLDARSMRLIGYRLDGTLGRYRPIVPQGGRWASQVLGLDLALEGRRVRFYHGSAPLLEAAELITKLETMMDDIARREEKAERDKEEAERRTEEAERAQKAAESAQKAAERRAEALAQRLRELGVDPDKA